jgi:DNA-binding HxlR family transcriptional regulator
MPSPTSCLVIITEQLKENKVSYSQKIGEKYGGRIGQDIGKQREQTILAWLARWRYSTYNVLAVVMNINNKAAAEKLYKLEKKHLVQKVTTLHARNHYVYRLTPLGLSSFKQLSERKIPNIPTPSDLSGNTRIPHDLSVQIAVAYLRRKDELIGFLTTFEFIQENKKNNYKAAIKPDAILIYNGYRCALELERRGKSDTRLLGKFDDMRKDFSRKEQGVFDNHHTNMSNNQEIQSLNFAYSCILYVNTDSSGQRYQNTLRSYYNRKSKTADNPSEFFKGWFESYEIQYDNELTKIIESIVDEKIIANKKVMDLL